MRTKTSDGMTLIEVVVALCIFAVAMVGLYSLIIISTRVSTDSRARLDATALANERIEMVRNLAYDDVGTIGGIPNGTLPQTEALTVNRILYTIKIDVIYVDDPFDGLLNGVPNDLFNTDYKRVRVEVSWPNMLNHNPVVLISDASPKGIENNNTGGTLMLTAFDANGNPVPTPTVHIFNDNVAPPVNLTAVMGADGRYVLPGMPVAQETYDISVTKAGYNTSSTYPVDAGNPTPTPPPASIFAGTVTSLSFTIDRLSTLTVQTRDPNGVAIGPVQYHLRGSKTIGSDAAGDPIYKYNQTNSTDASGKSLLNNMEWDTYQATMDSIATGYDIAGTNPPGLINLIPGANQTFEMTLVPHTDHTLLVTVRDQLNGLMAGATARLTRVAPPYDVTQTTAVNGQTFFTALAAGDYTLTVHAAGYVDVITPVTINGQSHVEVSWRRKQAASVPAGFTLIETMVAMAIFSLAIVILYNFYLQGVKAQRYTNEQAQAVNSLRQGIETMVKELREARYGDDGSYILSDAQDQEIVFYSDIDTDETIEKVRYFLSGTSLYKGVTKPINDPPTYDSGVESITELSPYVRNGIEPVFIYYNGDYPGDVVNNPLPTPSRLTDTKMVRLHLLVNVDISHAPDSLEVISNVQIRNLKTNL